MTKSDETKKSKSVAIKSETTPAKAKKSKKPAKPGKVPSVLTKKYTAKKLDKLFYKKIYIPDDKKFFQSFFVELEEKNKKGEALLSVPKDTKITKKEEKRLKLICKEIKKQKGGIKLAPIVAILVFVTVLCVGVTLTKNFIARTIITNTCESIFEAKTDIDYLNIRFLDSSFKMKGLEIANKNAPMKNLIQVDSIVLDFEFSQLLRSRFIADELSITGVATNTDRKTSGDLTAKKLAKLEKKKAKEAEKAAKASEDSAFMKNLNTKKDLAMNTLMDSVNGLFDQYNPKTIVDNCYSQLESPTVAKKVQESVPALTAKYQELPAKMETEYKKVQESTAEVLKIDINSIKSDPVKLKEAITAITTAISSSKDLKDSTEKAVNDMKSDLTTVTSISKELQSAINHDQNIVTKELNKLTSLSLQDAKNFITDTFNNVGYNVLGKYYPYVQKAVNYLVNLKNTNKAKEEKVKTEKTKSTVTKRSAGRTVFFPTETAPKFWIKKASGSGNNFSLNALNITSNMDKTGKPATGTLKLSQNNIDHGANFTVDTRSYSNEPLITADYDTSKIPLSFPASNFGNTPGVPGLDSSNTKLKLNMKVYENSGFKVSGTGDFTNMVLSAAPFEPAFASDIFLNTLTKVDSMLLNIDAGYTEADGVIMKLTSDADKKFMTALNSALTAQMNDVVEKAKVEINAKISELTKGASDETSKFSDIQSQITKYVDLSKDLSSQLETKKKEAEKALADATKNAVTDKINSKTEDIKNNAAGNLKGLLKK